jgi:riboflavin kinase/FMN adenylyltransferase
MRIVTEDASKLSARSVAITFDRNPMELIRPSRFIKYVTTLDQKLQLIAEQGIETAVVIPLNHEILDMTGPEFVAEVLQKRLSAVRLVVGTDFAFGKNLSGNVKLLRELGPKFGFDVTEVSPIRVGEMRVSSTAIRRLLGNGQIDVANTLLNHPFVISGLVVSGAQIGRTIGFPTANLRPIENQVIPRAGVYAASVHLPEGTMPGVVNIGFRPTVHGESETIELHIIGFSGDLYGQVLHVAFLHRLRDEIHFPDLESLKKQIDADVHQALSMPQRL